MRHVPVHGKTTEITHDGDGPVRRAAVAAASSAATTRSSSTPTLPDCLRVTATGGGVVMARRSTASCPRYGVQFHPESVLTPEGKRLLENFLCRTRS